MSNIFERLVIVFTDCHILGCTQDELDLISGGLQLPKDYEQFMLLGGKGVGDLLSGEDFYFPEVLHLRRDAELLLSENNEPFSLPDQALVFLMHQGYEFLFFDCSAADTRIYQYVEGAGSPKQVWDSFSLFLEDAVNQYLSVKCEK